MPFLCRAHRHVGRGRSRRAIIRGLLAATFAFVLGCGQPALAISGNQQIELAGSGRFDELAKALEPDAAAGALRTPDLHALCFAYSKLKQYTKLFACLDRLEQQVANGDRSTRLFGLDDATPVVHIMRAQAFIDFGRYREATESARRVLTWMEREHSDDKDIEVDSLATLVIASVYVGDRAAAEGYFARLEKVDVSWPRYNAYANAKAYALARSCMAIGLFDKALQALSGNKGFAFQVFLDNLLSGATFKGANNWVWVELPRGYMVSKSLKELGRRAEAKAGYAQLLNVKEAVANGEIYWLILYDRGQIAEDEQSDGEAVDYYGRAIDVIESQRATINSEINKIGFVGHKQEVYDRIIRLLLKAGKADSALEYVERSKSRALIDMLAARLVTPDFIRPAASAQPALANYLAAEADAKVQAPLLGSQGGDRIRRADRARDELHVAAPEIASLIAVDKVSVASLQKLLGRDETLVQYYVQGDIAYAFVLNRIGLATFPLDGVGLEASIRDFRTAVQTRGATPQEMAQRLYDRLIRPLSAKLTTPNLLIVPHGPLHYMSFAALHDGSGYLIDRFGLRNLPSASVLEFLRPRPVAPGSPMLILGNPDLESAALDLPNAQVEAESLARTNPQAKLLTRRAATETAFDELAGRYSRVHIASHGDFSAETPLASALLLAKDEANDGRLTVAELYSLKLNADLVTLSACETGLGQVASGDDVVGLSRGLLFAGASSIIASLWEVPDRPTAFLMERLYFHLARVDKRQALRNAQIDTKKIYPRPQSWAGFYLIGSDQ